jgi:UPF0176 protein
MPVNSHFEVLLYYKYTPIDDPEKFMKDQKSLCQKLGLKGRILIAHEGINGTVEGLKENTQKYIEIMKKDPRFAGIVFKKSQGTGDAFPKLRIRVRPEIVEGDLDNLDVRPWEVTGKYLTSEELHEWFRSNREFYIVDMRNDYEQLVGYFEGSILSKMAQFRDLPKFVEKLKHLKGKQSLTLRDKTIVTVCTGGVRCEKASGFLVKNGFANVYQLKDGIVTYMEKYPNEDFKGSLYVFDNRLIMGFNREDPKREIVGKCMKCGQKSETYVNCAYDFCHLHFICCKNCLYPDKKAYCRDKCFEIKTQNKLRFKMQQKLIMWVCSNLEIANSKRTLLYRSII